MDLPNINNYKHSNSYSNLKSIFNIDMSHSYNKKDIKSQIYNIRKIKKEAKQKNKRNKIKR